MSRYRALLPLLATLLIGCGTAGPSPSAAPTFAQPTAVDQAPPVDKQVLQEACQFGALVFDVGPVVLCQKAIELAIERLGPLHWPITSIHFILSLCPPGAPCAAPTEKEGWVIFTFTAGLPIMVHVGPAGAIAGVDGPLIPDAPQEVPGWLAAQLSGQVPG
jgi:hypothetical protein